MGGGIWGWGTGDGNGRETTVAIEWARAGFAHYGLWVDPVLSTCFY